MRGAILPVVLALALMLPAAAHAAAPAEPLAADIGPDEIRDRVFESVQYAMSSSAGQALAQVGARIAAGSDALAALVRERQDLLDAQDRLEARLFQTVAERGVEAEAETRSLQGRIATTTARLEEIDAVLSRDFPEFKALTSPGALSRAEVQRLLAPDEALLLVLVDIDATFVWAISPTAAGWWRAEIGRDRLEQMVRDLRATLSPRGETRGAEALDDDTPVRGAGFDRALAHELYRLLFAPLEPVFGTAAHVLSVTDGALTSLPLAVLVTDPPEGADDDPAALRGTAWMFRAHALSTLPNVASLRVLRGAAPAGTQEEAGPRDRFRGFGDPLLGYRLARTGAAPATEIRIAAADVAPQVHTRGVYADVTEVAQLAPLPNTGPELRRLAEVLGAGPDSVRLGAEATEAAVKAADLTRTRILAFATHGLLTGGIPGLEEPALVFTPPAAPTPEDDALLTASEAAQLKLSADLIILSACDTAGSDGRPGAEGLSGLARAFIYAGARAILVSHWPVDDYASAVLTTRMLAGMAEGGGTAPLGRAEALRAAMLGLLAEEGDPRLAHPRIWAPFVVVGEGG